MDKNQEEEFILKWRAPEINPASKGESWYWIIASVALVVIALSIWQGNFLFAVFIVLSLISILFLSREEKEEFLFSLFKDGIKINDTVYPLTSFQNFSIFETERDLSFLYLHKHQNISFPLRLPIKTSDIEKIRSFLNNYLTEAEHDESILDSISHYIGF